MAYKTQTHILNDYMHHIDNGMCTWPLSPCGTKHNGHGNRKVPDNFIDITAPGKSIADITCKHCLKVAKEHSEKVLAEDIIKPRARAIAMLCEAAYETGRSEAEGQLRIRLEGALHFIETAITTTDIAGLKTDGGKETYAEWGQRIIDANKKVLYGL